MAGSVDHFLAEALPPLGTCLVLGSAGFLGTFLAAVLVLQGLEWGWTWNREKLLSFRIFQALNGRSGRIDRFVRYSLLSFGKRVAVEMGRSIARFFRVLSDRYREEHEVLRMETEAQLLSARAEAERLARERLELERARGIENTPVLLQARVLKERLEEIPDARIRGGDGENVLFKLYLTLQKRLEKVSTVPLRTREEFTEATVRLNDIEALLAGYDERIRRIQESDLPEEQKANDIAFLERLRESDVAQLEAA